MPTFDLPRRLVAEILGTALLVATVVGSGIMAETLTKDVALALLGNTLATGAILVVLITILGPISGAHFNPAVSLVFALRRELSAKDTARYIAAQIIGGILGTMIAHGMFALPLLDASIKIRTGGSQWFAEAVAAFGLVMTILAGHSISKKRGAVASRPLYHRGLLVHRIDLVRQSCRCGRTLVHQYLLRNSSSRPAGIYYRRALRCRRRHALDDLAFAPKWI